MLSNKDMAPLLSNNLKLITPFESQPFEKQTLCCMIMEGLVGNIKEAEVYIQRPYSD